MRPKAGRTPGTCAEDDRRRIADIEGRLNIHEEVIAELQRDGLVDHDQVVHLQEALRTSRMIGAAIGMVMATRKVSEVEAFARLNGASQNSNRKIRVVANEVVSSGEVGGLSAD